MRILVGSVSPHKIGAVREACLRIGLQRVLRCILPCVHAFLPSHLAMRPMHAICTMATDDLGSRS
jgi:hypothetical protein